MKPKHTARRVRQPKSPYSNYTKSDEPPLSIETLVRSAGYTLEALQSAAAQLSAELEKLPGLENEMKTQIKTLRATLKALEKKINQRNVKCPTQ